MRQPPLPSTIRLPGFSPATGANSSQPGIRSDIAPLSGRFASEKPGECTYVLDPGGERRKARSGKARSLREQKWYAARDSNPQALRRWDLNPMRLPIPPAAPVLCMVKYSTQYAEKQVCRLEKILFADYITRIV